MSDVPDHPLWVMAGWVRTALIDRRAPNHRDVRPYLRKQAPASRLHESEGIAMHTYLLRTAGAITAAGALALPGLAGTGAAATARPAAAPPRVIATIPVPGLPLGIAASTWTGSVYVTSAADNSVSVINGRTNKVTATIPAPTPGSSSTYGIAASPRTGAVYVTNTILCCSRPVARTDSVSVINPRTNKVTATIPVGVAPRGVAVSARTGAVYVASASGSVSVINGRTNKVTATIPVGSEPVGVAVSPRTGAVYVANQFDNTVSVINGRTNKVTATIPVDREPWGVTVSRRTGAVYVSNFGGATVSVISGKDAR